MRSQRPVFPALTAPISGFQNVNVNGRYVKTDVELWDSSGDPNFRSCWPAIGWETHGVIFVFNPEEDQQVFIQEWLFFGFAQSVGIRLASPQAAQPRAFYRKISKVAHPHGT